MVRFLLKLLSIEQRTNRVFSHISKRSQVFRRRPPSKGTFFAHTPIHPPNTFIQHKSRPHFPNILNEPPKDPHKLIKSQKAPASQKKICNFYITSPTHTEKRHKRSPPPTLIGISLTFSFTLFRSSPSTSPRFILKSHNFISLR